MTIGHVMRCELSADLAEVGAARRFVRENLADVSDSLNADAQLIASELVTNAVEHGRGARIAFALLRGDGSVELTVESIGAAPDVGDVDDWEVAPAEQVNGRGLGIVRSIADRVEVTRFDGRLAITASLTL